MPKLSATMWLTFFFATFFFIWGIFIPFWGIWLTHKGMSAEDIGLLFSVALVLRFVSTLMLPPLISTGSATIRIVQVLGALTLISLAVLFYFNDHFWLALITLALNFLLAPLIALGDIIGMRLVNQIKLDYGKVRLWGSLAFIAGSTFVGWMITQYGNEMIYWVLTAMVASMLFVTLFKFAPTLKDMPATGNDRKTPLMTLLKDRNVQLFLLVVGIIQASHGAYYAFSSIYWVSQGISGFTVSILWAIAVAAEILAMRFNTRLFSRWSIKQMILLGLCATILRWGLLSFAENIYLLGLSQALHAFTFAVTHLAAIRYIGQQKHNNLISFQSLYTGISMGLMMAIFTYIAGVLYAPLQANLFLVMAAMVLPAFWLLHKWNTEAKVA